MNRSTVLYELERDLFGYLDDKGPEFVQRKIISENKNTQLHILWVSEILELNMLDKFLPKEICANLEDVVWHTSCYNESYFDGFETRYPNNTVECWPWYFLFASKLHTHNMDNAKHTADKLFCCMNYKPRLHRKVMMDKLAKYDLMDNYITWHTPPMPSSPIGNVYQKWGMFNDLMDTLIEPKYDYKHWHPKYLTFDSEWHQYSVPIEIGKSAINLVTETDYNKPFITEKTWNPILWGKSFIIMGNTGIHKHLVDQGFVLPDVIDYTFDSEDNLDKRCDMIAEELKRLSSFDVVWLQKELEEAEQHNQKHAHRLMEQIKIPEIIHKTYKNLLNLG